MDCDGTQAGYDLDLTRAIAEAVRIPVIASGGVGNLQHIADAFTIGKAARRAGRLDFSFWMYTIGEAKRFLAERGIPVRPCRKDKPIRQ